MNAAGRLAKRIIDAGGTSGVRTEVDDFKPLTKDDVKVGQVVYGRSYGRFRRGIVTKIGRKKITVATVTPAGVDQALDAWHRDVELRAELTGMTDEELHATAVKQNWRIQDYVSNGRWTQEAVDQRNRMDVERFKHLRAKDDWYDYVAVVEKAWVQVFVPQGDRGVFA